MEKCWIIARSMTYAQRMQMALLRAGIRTQVFRAPREVSDLGCAYAVELSRETVGTALRILAGADLPPLKLYGVSPRGELTELLFR